MQFLPPPSPSPPFLSPPVFFDVPPTTSAFQYIDLLPAYISNSTLAPYSTKHICGDIPFPIDEGYWNCFHTNHFAYFPRDFEFFYNFVRDTELEIPCDCGIKNPFLPTNCGSFKLELRIGVDVAFVNCVIRKSLFPPAINPLDVLTEYLQSDTLVEVFPVECGILLQQVTLEYWNCYENFLDDFPFNDYRLAGIISSFADNPEFDRAGNETLCKTQHGWSYDPVPYPNMDYWNCMVNQLDAASLVPNLIPTPNFGVPQEFRFFEAFLETTNVEVPDGCAGLYKFGSDWAGCIVRSLFPLTSDELDNSPSPEQILISLAVYMNSDMVEVFPEKCGVVPQQVTLEYWNCYEAFLDDFPFEDYRYTKQLSEQECNCEQLCGTAYGQPYNEGYPNMDYWDCVMDQLESNDMLPPRSSNFMSPQEYKFFKAFLENSGVSIPAGCIKFEKGALITTPYAGCIVRSVLEDAPVVTMAPSEIGIDPTENDVLKVTLLIFPEKIDESKSTSIAQTITASVSFISSIALICIIQRSYTGFASTFNRLLLGLSIADILSSFWLMLSTSMSPTHTSGYIWNPRGNVHTCDTQGFFLFLGIIGAPLYNCSMCFYYLAVIKFNKKDTFIRKKLEPYFHAVPILLSLIGAITILSKESFNANGSNCWINKYPPYCGVEVINSTEYEIPCERGKDAMVLFSIFAIAPSFTLPIVIIVTMVIMYRVAIKNEKKISKYGVGSLRKNVDCKPSIAINGDSNNNSTVSNRWSSLKKWWSKASATKSNNAKWQSQTILHKATSYSMAYFLTYLFPFVTSVQYLAGYQSSSTLRILVGVFLPLQGFFNFLVFMFPRVMNARRTKKLSWCQSFMTAIKSRGANKKRGRPAAGGGSGKSRKKKVTIDTTTTTTTPVASMKPSWKKNRCKADEEEEEKVEIETFLPGLLKFDESPHVSVQETNSVVKYSLIDSSIPQDRQRSHLNDVVSESKSASKNRAPTIAIATTNTTTTTTIPTNKQSPSASVSSSVSSDKSSMPRERMILDIEKGYHDQKLPVDIHDKEQEDECNLDLRDESDIETGLALLDKVE